MKIICKMNALFCVLFSFICTEMQINNYGFAMLTFFFFFDTCFCESVLQEFFFFASFFLFFDKCFSVEVYIYIYIFR